MTIKIPPTIEEINGTFDFFGGCQPCLGFLLFETVLEFFELVLFGFLEGVFLVAEFLFDELFFDLLLLFFFAFATI